MDKLRAITFFCRVVENKSFAAAASALDVVPSALSKTIAALERDVGVRLFLRSTRALSLTDEGGRYYEECRRVLQQLEQAEAAARGSRTEPRGLLRVGMHPGLRSLVLGSIAGLLDRFAELRVETTVTNAGVAVVDEGLDVVIRIGPLPDSTLVARRIGVTRSLCCASPAYVARFGTPTHPDELASHRGVVYARRDEDPNTAWSFVRGKERCTVKVPVILTVRDGIGLVDAASAGCGIARPFEVPVRALLQTGGLVSLLPEWTAEPCAIYAVLPPYSRTTPAKIGVLLESIQGALH